MRFILAVALSLAASSTVAAAPMPPELIDQPLVYKIQKKQIGRSRFCRAVFSCRARGNWGACMRQKGYSGKRGSGWVCDRNPATRR